MAKAKPVDYKKEISRLRSELRALQNIKKDINAFTGIVSGNYWTQTGMPWIAGEGRKAVLTEYFWQPIRGQPRRVDTNELRQFSQDFWVSACVKTLMDEVGTLEWDIVPEDDYEYEWVADAITDVKSFFQHPNKNNEPFSFIIKALLKDILEIDAGVIVKVFDINSYNFDEIEPKSGAPMLKPPGQRRMTELYVRDGASFLKEIDKFGFLKGFWQYSYQIPAHPMWFNREEICYVIEHPRSMSCYGFSRTQAILDIMKSLHYSVLYNKRFFEESPIPDGALSLLDTNEEEMNAFRTFWNQEFKAQPHKVAVMNKDMKWLPFNITQRELEFLDTQKWYFNTVITMYGLTPTEMGITEDANRATSASQSEVVKRKGVRPFLTLIEDALNSDILPEFGFEGIKFQFIYDDPAEKNARLTNYKMELEMGTMTVNEVREEEGREPIPGGDVSNSLLARMGVASSAAPSAGPQSQGMSDEEQRAAPGSQDQMHRAEGDNKEKNRERQMYDEVKERVHDPYSDSAGPKGIKSTEPQMGKPGMGHSDEWWAMYHALRRQGHSEESAAKITNSKQGKKKAEKGVDDGQYYRDQPITQHRRPSGADYQPKNTGYDNALPNPWSGVQPDGRMTRVLPHTDVQPARLGSTHAQPGKHVFNSDADEDKIHCPICGQATLTVLNAMEQLPETFRCTNCGGRFKTSDLMQQNLQEEISNVLQANPQTQPPSRPGWMMPKSFDKKYEDMDVKEYVGFDTSKSMYLAAEYAASGQYLKLLQELLSDVKSLKLRKIAEIIATAIKSGSTLRDTSSKIEEVVEDPERAKQIARTEIVRVANEGNVLQMKQDGVKKVEWLSAPEDGRLCKRCKEKNGKKYPIDEAKGQIPLHPSCRCTLLEARE